MDAQNINDEAEIRLLRMELASLRDREQDLTDLIENASLGLHWVGADGVILWANQSQLDLLGYARDEYVGHHIAEFHVDSAVTDHILERLGNKETLRNYEARLRSKRGGIRHVQISSSVRWLKGEFVHTRCFMRDVTENKRQEQRLLAQYGAGRILSAASSFEAAAPPLLETIGARLDWRAGFFWTPEQESLRCRASWEDPSIVGRGFAATTRQFVFPPGVGLPGRIWQHAKPHWIADLRRDQNFPRSQLVSNAGLHSAFGFPIMVSGNVLGVAEFFADEIRLPDDDLLFMTESLGYQIGEFLERTRAQERLAEREEGYRVLTETASDGIITIDRNSAILFANTAAAKLFGYSREELTGADLTLIMPEHSRELHKKAVARYLETGQRRFPSWQVIRLTGQHRHGYEISLEVSFGEYRNGKEHLFVGVLRDITQRERLDASMRHTARLESLGVLAGGIAHDFNNLLTGILGNISLANDMLPDDDPVRETLQNAVKASERAANLTQQMLAYAGKGQFLIEPINVSAIVREISTLIKSSIPKHVILRLDLEQSLPMVDGDAAQLQQLVMNLVINGAEAIPEGRIGRLLVMTRRQQIKAEDTEELGPGEIQPGNYVSINVSDNGEGIAEATIAKIFDPFFTTKFTGRGLGLAAALGIVRGHKGALKVFSIPGEGTTFRVFLPASAAAVKKGPDAPENTARLAGRGTVLVVEDEQIVLRFAANCLQHYGYEVVSAENGRTGVECFRELHEQLSMVVLDSNMPVMNGEEALSDMQSIDPEVPVVLCSGYNEREVVERFRGKGLAGFLQKPYTAAQLTEKVRAISRKAGRC